MILLKGITKRYGALTVYENFDFSIEDGTVTCILGESGSGKTTLLNILAGLTPFEGSVSPQPRCSYVFQQPRLVPSLLNSPSKFRSDMDRTVVPDWVMVTVTSRPGSKVVPLW